ncbi:hypothetical protein [Gimesia sp.]|uniref:hypothetical protein n=1 Tax=Gimesia sp. TaxID=2024833 RepID=UPI0025B82BB3|nr:hypothetical protein [Gimesia sp.]
MGAGAAHACGAGAQQALGAGAAHALGAGVQQSFFGAGAQQLSCAQPESVLQQRFLNQPRSLRAGLQHAGAASLQQGGLIDEH